ncbi:hypothetical protein EJB05_44502, partial [Eragrostis curvula]
MKDIVASPGTPSGLALRVSQVVCALGSLVAMGNAFGFSNYSAYLYSGFSHLRELQPPPVWTSLWRETSSSATHIYPYLACSRYRIA